MEERLARQRILIVDDAPENIDVLGSALEGYARSAALSGEQALRRALADAPPDLILLDVMMPGMDGYEVCRRLKAEARTRDIPVIFVTAKGDVEDETLGFALGAVDYITKPISVPIVQARVRTQLLLKLAREEIRQEQALIESIKLESIIKIDSELNHQIQDLDLLLERILLEARKVVHADAGSIYVREEDRLAIKYAQNDTLRKELPPGQKPVYSLFTVPIDEKTISGYCALTGELVNVPDVYDIPADAPYSFNTGFDRISGYTTTSNLAVPLKTTEGTILGVIQVMNARNAEDRTMPFSKADELVMRHFASSATVAFQRAYLNREMILRLIRMSELRDPKETGAHVSRVAGYAVEMYDAWAHRHRVDGQEREKKRDALKIAAMLHDVGKVAIPDQILKKPARLTPEEFAVMQTHCRLGARLFGDPQSILDTTAVTVVRTHHENWDGSGYPGQIDIQTGDAVRADGDGKPRGLRGEEIPLEGRIVSIADVFDALSSQRVYKQAWGEQDVLEELRRLEGTKFDPELVELFRGILPSIRQVQEMYPEQA